VAEFCRVVKARAVADPADAKVRLRRSGVKALPSLAAARPQIELSALKAADSRILCGYEQAR
jgi:hypothetical protein